MHIAINAQLLSATRSYRSAGVSNYCRNLLTAMGKLVAPQAQTEAGFPSTPSAGPPIRLSAFVGDRGFHATGITTLTTALPVERPLARILWEQLALPAHLGRLHADVQHGLVNVLALAAPIPGVVTVHDLSFVRLPDKFPAAKRFYLTRLCRASVERAARVIAVSRQTADDLIRFFQLPAHKIDVIHNGVEARFQPSNAVQSATFRRAKGLPERFFLFVGTLEPRKNLESLLSAFARFHTLPAYRDIHLVMAGGKGWFFEDIFRRVTELGLEDCVHFPGFVPDSELPAWYGAATAFVYPSLFEGFGLPVLEAMACGTPVVCSRAGSLLEIVGEAAITAPATDGDSWVAALTLIASQEQLRSQLREMGPARAAHFSWDATARHTLELYAHL